MQEAVNIVGYVSVAAYCHMSSDPIGIRVDRSKLEKQSFPVNPETPWIRKSPIEDKFAEFKEKVGNPQTLYEGFLNGVKISGDKRCLKWISSTETNENNSLTYYEVLVKCTSVGNGLRHAGLEPTNQTYVGVFSNNRYELVLIQLGCYQHSMVVVPMYETMDTEELQHVLEQTGMTLIFCGSEEKLKLLLRLSSESTKKVQTIVMLDEVELDDALDDFLNRGWIYLTLARLESNGRVYKCEQNLCKPENNFVVSYTSGTDDGKPKGAMISHNGLVQTMLAVFLSIEESVGGDLFCPGGDNCHISYLPLTNAYEQILTHLSLTYGWEIGFYSDDTKLHLEEIKNLQPTIFPCESSWITNFYDKVMHGVTDHFPMEGIFARSLAAKQYYYQVRGIITKSTIWDKLAFRNVQNLLGGQVKLIIVGNGLLAAPVLRFCRLAFGAIVIEGFGNVEQSTVSTVGLPGDNRVGEVGGPLACTLVKVEDVPEMAYLEKNMVGEVCTRSYYQHFHGYLDEGVPMTEALDSDGWLHTGDIGRWTERGALQIIDRVDNLITLSTGDIVDPEKVERVYCSGELVAQCFIHGDSRKSCLVAILVLKKGARFLLKLPNKVSKSMDFKELCSRDDVKYQVFDEMILMAKTAFLPRVEIIRDLHIHPEYFTIDNNLLTRTSKLKRIELKKKFKKVIKEMYMF